MAYRSTSAKPSSTGSSNLLYRYRARKSLADIISDQPVDPGSMVQTLIDILNSLVAIHARQWSHVPLTPATIRFNEQGQAEIANHPSAETQSTVIFGSEKYAAPDALRQGSNQQECAELDSYILGFIFYELLLGKRLFEEQFKTINKISPSSWLTWHAHSGEYARPLVEVIAEFPPGLSQIIAGMMEKDPKKRNTDLMRISETLQSTIENTSVITDLTPIEREETIRTEVSLAARSSQRMNRAEQAVLGILRAVRGKYRASRIRRALPRMLAVSQVPDRNAAGHLFTKLRRSTTSGGTESVVRPAAGIVGARFYVSLAGLVLLAVPVWLWKSTACSRDVPASLPPVILTDTGEMVLIRADEVGPAAAGVQGEKLRRQTVSTAFYMDRHEVPMRYYWKFCHATGRSLPTSPVWDPHYAERPDNPILNVSWTDAYAFAEWAGKWLPSMPEWKVASTTAGHLLDFHVFETAPLGVRSYSWVDAGSWDPLAQSGLAARRYVDGKVSVPVPVSDLDGTDAIPFRCAASSEILQTSHFLGSTDPSRTGSLR